MYYRVRIRPEDSKWVVEVKKFYLSIYWKELRGINGGYLHFTSCDAAVAFIVASGLNKTYRLFNSVFDYGDYTPPAQLHLTLESQQAQMGKETQ